MERLGKKLKVGDTFISVTKKMQKSRSRSSTVDKITRRKLNTYEVLKPGNVRILQKGKRIYVCEVVGMIETRTGLYVYSFKNPREWWNRWWQFSYLVKILEN